jgi:mono/diheme cytochrome c family protein
MPDCRPGLAAVLLIVAAHAHAHVAAQPQQRVAQGQRIYAAQCAACHGAHGEGQPGWESLDAAGERLAPPHDRTGHTWKHSDAMLYRIVAEGWRDPFNRTQRLTMPPFGQALPPDEIRAAIDYLKTLWTPRQRAFQREESRNAPYPFNPERTQP